MKQPLEVYLEKITHYTLEINLLKQKITHVSWWRFALILVVIVFEYLHFKQIAAIPFHGISILGIIAFIFLVRRFNRLKFELLVLETYLNINKDEAALLQDGLQAHFSTGSEFINHNHPYSFDLDIFGENSLYQRLNRGNTFLGQQKLALWLSTSGSAFDIKTRQDAVRELAEHPDIYQEILVFTNLGKDNTSTSKHLSSWQKTEHKISFFSQFLSYLLPTAGLVLTILLWVTGDSSYFKWASIVFIANISHFNRFRKPIVGVLGQSEKISATIKGYSNVLALIEKHQFQSELLQELQSKVTKDGQKASISLTRLARILESLESVHNGFAMAFFNGTVQFHLHTYLQLLKWKKQHANSINTWVETIADFEALISLANFHFNFPETNFPELNNDYTIQFEELGHPLLNSKNRVTNSIDFSKQSYTILTGSNMSGKSTFLRTVGLGIVLANAGAPVPCIKGSFTPIQLAASMRLTDSLAESTSYFYAEVKRLEFIMEQLKKGPLFVLLDEILRGTNSDDKKTGTIGVIEKIIEHQVFGLIATHDLEVCEIASKHPQRLINRCFEVDFIGEDLYFDYKLRDGICKNKSATFIMKKHGVI